MPSAKMYLKFQKAKHDCKTSSERFYSDIDKAQHILLGLIPATQSEKEEAKKCIDDLYAVSDNEYRKEQKRLAKKLAKKSKVVRGGRP